METIKKAKKILETKSDSKSMINNIKKTIAICIPAYGTVTAEFMIGFLKFMRQNQLMYNLQILMRQDIPVDKCRNELSKSALSCNPDYILWIDSDMILPTDTLTRLIGAMEEKEADLITAIYFGKPKPHTPHIREYRLGGYWAISGVTLGETIEIDGCGFGCCLVKPDVFKKIEFPWFKSNYEKWGKKEIQLSEDLYFCRQVMNQKGKMYCDTGCIASHIGSSVDIWEYSQFSQLQLEAKANTQELFKDLRLFTKQTAEEVNEKVMIGPELIKNEWNEKNPQGEAEIKKFYKETENYLYDLTLWHTTGRYQFDTEVKDQVVQNIKNPKRVLDFGCGIGANSFLLAKEGINVTLADLKSKTLEFAEFRFKENNLSYKKWETDIEDNPPEKKYEVILVFDVLEHLPKNECKTIVEKLIKLKHKSTKIILSISFGKSKGHPMHFDSDKEYEELVDRLVNESPE